MNVIQTLLDEIVKHMTSLKSCDYVMAGMTVLANKMVSIRRERRRKPDHQTGNRPVGRLCDVQLPARHGPVPHDGIHRQY